MWIHPCGFGQHHSCLHSNLSLPLVKGTSYKKHFKKISLYCPFLVPFPMSIANPLTYQNLRHRPKLSPIVLRPPPTLQVLHSPSHLRHNPRPPAAVRRPHVGGGRPLDTSTAVDSASGTGAGRPPSKLPRRAWTELWTGWRRMRRGWDMKATRLPWASVLAWGGCLWKRLRPRRTASNGRTPWKCAVRRRGCCEERPRICACLPHVNIG